VAILDRGIEAAQKADVIAVDIDVHEAPYPSVLVTQPFLDAGKLLFQILDRRGDRCTADADFLGTSSESPQWCWNAHAYGHAPKPPVQTGSCVAGCPSSSLVAGYCSMDTARSERPGRGERDS